MLSAVCLAPQVPRECPDLLGLLKGDFSMRERLIHQTNTRIWVWPTGGSHCCCAALASIKNGAEWPKKNCSNASRQGDNCSVFLYWLAHTGTTYSLLNGLNWHNKLLRFGSRWIADMEFLWVPVIFDPFFSRYNRPNSLVCGCRALQSVPNYLWKSVTQQIKV